MINVHTADGKPTQGSVGFRALRAHEHLEHRSNTNYELI
jgi:hypothetical protein